MTTLALLAFALLLLLSLTTLARVDMAVATQARRSELARRHALCSVQIAIGRLQASAGPDQRATGRADLVCANPGNPFWTGVWGGGPTALTWLVSGSETASPTPSPDEPPAADPSPGNETVWLLRAMAAGTNRAIKLVRRPLLAVGIPGLEGPRVIGHYAWWVSDEGIKAKYNLVNPYAEAAPGSPENRWQLASAQQCGIEKLGTGFAGYEVAKTDSADGAAVRVRLGRVLAPAQIPYADDAITLDALRDRFHDLTTYSFGVLANAQAGGLKYDLTRGLEPGATYPSGAVFPGGPAWDLVKSYAQLRPEPAEGDAQISPRPQTLTRHGVHPVVILVQIGWGGDLADGRLRLLLEPLVVLANPWDAALAPADYRLTWRQSGVVELRNPPGAADAAVAGDTPAQLLGGDLVLAIRQAGFRPGEARAFSLSADIPYPSGGPLLLTAGVARGRAWRDLPVAASASSRELMVRAAGGRAGFELSLDEGEVLQTAGGCATVDAEATGEAPVTGVPTRTALRLGDNEIDAPGGLRWLADFNLRAAASDEIPAWGQNPLYGAAVSPEDGGPATLFDGDAVCWGPARWGADGGRRFVTLFHVPREDLQSLGQLQHAALQPSAAGPGSTVGESYADPHTQDGVEDFVHRLNAAFWDRYFFSTLPRDSDRPRNHRLVPCARGGVPASSAVLHDGGAVAGHLLVDGSFNVNSTSVEAWQALLGSLNGQRLVWTDPATGTTTETTVGCAFPRSPTPQGGATDGWCGYREIDDAQLRDLATALVARIRSHGPFRSLAEFVNRPLQAAAEEGRLCGVLQAALDNTVTPPPSLAPVDGRTTNVRPESWPAWPAAAAGHRATLAPGWLSQADVLSALGPVLTVRSDTFLVRAYGDVVDPVTGVTTARAWCEAVVQRVPDYVDPADPPEASAGLRALNALYGRRFRIVSFRWLSPEEV